MTKIWKSALTAAALVIGAATVGTSTARAQIEPVKPLSVKIGAWLPIKDEIKDVSGDSIFAIEAGYVLQTNIESNSTTTLHIGYTERDNLRIIPVTLSETVRNPRDVNSSGGGFYYGGGLGFYFTRLEASGASNKTKPIFGGYGLVGYDINTEFFVEAKYNLISRYDRKNIDGLQFMVGARF